jgi:hypothetical protein
MQLLLTEGDILDQPADVIVNPWNRNIIPWWLLLPQGVSGAIKRRTGTEPFREVARHGPIPLGAQSDVGGPASVAFRLSKRVRAAAPRKEFETSCSMNSRRLPTREQSTSFASVSA